MCLATLGIAGAGISALGSIGGGIAQGNAASYQAQIAQNNAQTAENNAAYASAAGGQQAQTESLKNAETGAKIKTGMAANGVDVNSGSAVSVQSSQREVGQLDTENVLQNAELQSYGYRTQATGYQAQAALDESTAAEAPIGGALSGVGTLLGNASTIGTKYPTSWLASA